MSRCRTLTLALVVALLAPVVLFAPRTAIAQEAVDVLATDIYAGGCADGVGEPIATLVQPSLTEGDAVGALEARPVATSFTTVPLSLEALLADEHVIATAASEDQGTAACGAIGGLRTDAGAIVIELSEQGNSGLSGVAYLAPSGAGPGQTDISLFLAGLETAPPETRAEPTAEPTTEATAEAGQDAAPEATTELGEVPTEVTVSITNFVGTSVFEPDPVVIPVGGTVTWVNDDTIGAHGVMVVSPDGVENRSDVLLPGFGSYSQTFTEPGTYSYRDFTDLVVKGTIIVETAAESTAETTAEANQGAPGATETYVSPNFGYTVSYDPTQWTVVEEPYTDADGVDWVGLEAGFSTIYFAGIPGVSDAQACVQIMTDAQTSEANVVTFEPRLDEAGVPEAGGDTGDAFATTRITRTMDDGTNVDQAFYTRCIELPSLGAVLAIQQFAADIIYDTVSAQREELLQGLTLP